jgi:hypothetical protein
MTPTITPIPVTERKPGRDDTDAYGDAWYYEPERRSWRLREPTPLGLSKCSHWLPFDALPLPEQAF